MASALLHSVVIVIAAFPALTWCLRCVMCTSDGDPRCLARPGAPQDCAPNAKYCIVIKEFERTDSSDSIFGDSGSGRLSFDASLEPSAASPIFLGRSCVSFSDGDSCKDGVKNGKNIHVCKSYCNTDGCNAAPATTGNPAALGAVITAAIVLQAVK